MDNNEMQIEVIDNSAALMALNKSEIDIQIATAKRYPRSVKEFQNRALELVTLDEDTAASCFYKLPRSGKMIEGPSVRLAEIVVHSWKNMRAASRIVEVGDVSVVAQATALDLETNTAVSVEIRRRITNKDNKRFNDDMINVTCNAAASIAFREGVFKVVPRSLWKKVYDQAKLTAIGNASTLSERRGKAIAQFGQIGVTKERLLKRLGRAGEEDITLEDLETLTGLRTAIRENEITVDTAFADDAPEGSAPTPPAAADLNAKLAARKEELKRQASSQKDLARDTEGRVLGDLPPFGASQGS